MSKYLILLNWGVSFMTKWDDLSSEQQCRLQLPRSKLTSEERALRKRLFWGNGWIDAAGHEHRWQSPKTEEDREEEKNAKM